MFGVVQIWAQYRSIKGKVTDRKSGQPLVRVMVSSEGINAVTDSVGAYRIAVPSTAKYISFMYVGYDHIKTPIKGTLMNISLNPKINHLKR